METPPHPLRYYIILDDNEHGPFGVRELEQLIHDHVASPSSVVREEDSLQKVLLSDVLKNAEKYESNLKRKRIIPTLLLCIFVLFTILISMIFYGFYNRITSLENSLSLLITTENEGTLFKVNSEINIIHNKLNKFEEDLISLQEKLSENNSNQNKLYEETNKKLLEYNIQSKKQVSDLDSSIQEKLTAHAIEMEKISKTFSIEFNNLNQSIKLINGMLNKNKISIDKIIKNSEDNKVNLNKRFEKIEDTQLKYLESLNFLNKRIDNINKK